jgi:glycosyltransferase involved in cell wall biosynthesis
MIAANPRDVLLIAGCTQADVVEAMGGPLENAKAFGYLKDLRVCYAACDVVVLPSWHEGFPYSLLEGAAAGKPLIGSDVPGIDSIVTKENGLLVAPGDVQALAQALLALKKDNALREHMGRSSRHYVEQCFDRRDFGRFVVDYYNRIGIGGNGRASPVSVGDSLQKGTSVGVSQRF